MRRTLNVAVGGVLLACCAMLLFALEGALCLAMAFPFVAVLAVLGGIVGRAIAIYTRTPFAHVAAVLVFLPPIAGTEAWLAAPPLYEVQSSIEVDAPPEVVFSHVVGFSDLPAPAEWVFRTGVAFPLRAHIDGYGVGAVRRCEFTTGAFVEPITVWDEPRRLAFDVEAQPPSMAEWSPFANVHPPHLDTGLRARRGEFRLVPLEGGRTRLLGSTWYELSMWPQAYWRVYSDGLIHAIHERVLRHVKRLSESEAPRLLER